MTDSEFWRDLGAKFQALQPGVIGSYLTTSWTSGVWNQTGAQWLLSASDPQVKEEFVSLAEEAAAKYGATRLIQNADERWKLGGQAALFFWLDVLKRESGKYKSDHGPIRNADGSDAQGERGRINRVCEVSAGYCGKLARRGAAPAVSELPFSGFREAVTGSIPMSQPSRSEIDTSAGKAFAVDRKRILAEYETKLNHLPAQVGLTGNSGGYLPAVITCGKERVLEMILAWVDARVEAFTSYGVPSDTQTETDLKAFAQQITAASIAAIRGHLKLRSTRLRIAEEGSGVPWHLEIENAMGDALDGGLLTLQRQRSKFRDADKPLQPRPKASTESERIAVPQALDAKLKEAETRTEDPKLRKKLFAVVLHKHYFNELKALKASCKKYRTPALLKKGFPNFDVWTVLDSQDEEDITGKFDPSRFAWSLVKRQTGLTGKDDRTLKNYRKALKTAGIRI